MRFLRRRHGHLLGLRRGPRHSPSPLPATPFETVRGSTDRRPRHRQDGQTRTHFLVPKESAVQGARALGREGERGRVRDQSMNLRPLARPPSLLLPLLRPSPLPPLPYAALFIHTRIRSTRGGGRGSAAESGGARATSEAAGGRPLYYEAAFTLPLSSMQRLPSLPPPLFSA